MKRKNAKVECRREGEDEREEEKGDLHSHGLHAILHPHRSMSSLPTHPVETDFLISFFFYEI